MDALIYQGNRDGQEEINETHYEATILVAITIAP
jgi:hypothetical protein